MSHPWPGLPGGSDSKESTCSAGDLDSIPVLGRSPGGGHGNPLYILTWRIPCMKVKSESEVTQLCPTLSDPMDCSLPGSSIHGIFQARVLEWGAIAFSASLLSLLINFEMSWPIFTLKRLHISSSHERPLLLPLYWGLYLKVIHNVDKGCWIPNTSGFHMQNPS